MANTVQDQAPPARAAVARTPARLRKRKLTVAEAADQWERAKRALERQKALLDEAAPVLIAHFEKTGAEDYKGRIGWNWTGGGLVLDQPKVREFLGARLAAFQKRAKRSRALTLLR